MGKGHSPLPITFRDWRPEIVEGRLQFIKVLLNEA